INDFGREVIVKVDEEVFVTDYLGAPRCTVKMLEFIEILTRKRHSGPSDVLMTWHPADGGLAASSPTVRAVDDPFENAHVLAEARPHEFAFSVLAEPVDVKNLRRLAQMALHPDPVSEIVAHVIAAEGQHGHGVPADLADGADGGGCHFRTHGGSDINARCPVEGLINEWHRGCAAAAENEGADRHAVGIFPRRIDRWAL